jgi:lysyl-tRNA synthetase class 2
VIPAASFVSDFWNDQLAEHDRQWLFLVLVGLVLSFGFIRLSTRLMRSPKVPWWPGSIVSDGGLHVHHLVFGVVLMMVAGTISFAGFAVTPFYEICAFAFGVGIGLTIDEFALFLYLDDVYWAEEGRRSVDATVIAVAFMGLILLGVQPFEIDSEDPVTLIVSLVLAALFFGVIAICMLKHRIWHGLIGFFLFPLAIYGASRIGKPDSPWARRFYGERNPKKQAKAEHRFPRDRRTERAKERIRDAIGGTTEEEYRAKIEGRG